LVVTNIKKTEISSGSAAYVSDNWSWNLVPNGDSENRGYTPQCNIKAVKNVYFSFLTRLNMFLSCIIANNNELLHNINKKNVNLGKWIFDQIQNIFQYEMNMKMRRAIDY
jgi:hypothetical protein